jgi:outer membrane protein OmpA-like peptidoglycan-associated protein
MDDIAWRARQLCEIPNGRFGPQIVHRLRRNRRPSQLDSWCDPRGHWDPKVRSRFPDLVGQIFFATNDKQLDATDRAVTDAALDYWRSYHANFYRSTRVLFKFVGNADPRGSASYNLSLARERAGAVQRRFDEAFVGYPYYYSGVESLGESKANYKDLAGDRRVDIFTNFKISHDDSVSFDNYLLNGKYRGDRTRKFKMRVFAGGGVSIGPFGGSVMSVEIMDPRFERSAMYVLTGTNAGISIGLNRPTGWSDIDTVDMVSIDDFEGNGGIFSVSVGVTGGTILRFEGPKERGITNKALAVPTTGWDLNVGFSSDGPGYWHRVGD